jgi:glycerol-3-phosphate acyltransferase PlsY
MNTVLGFSLPLPFSFPLLPAIGLGMGALLAYLIGSVNFAVWVSRWFRLADPRSYGSGNPGATNVLRSGHRAAAAITLLLDAGKGYACVMLIRWVYHTAPVLFHDMGLAAVALAVFLGHVFPVFFGFRGGKGVATAAGVLLGIHPLLGLATVLTWLLTARLSGYSSLAAILSSVLAPFYALAYVYGPWGGPCALGGHPLGVLLALITMSLVLLWRHQGNLLRLWKGTEPKIVKR